MTVQSVNRYICIFIGGIMYNYKSLKEMVNNVKDQVQSGTKPSEIEAKTAIAAAHALDFMDVARQSRKPLHLTIEEDGDKRLAEVGVRLALNLMKSAKSEREIIDTLISKMGGYLLFQVINDFSGDEDIICEPAMISNGTLGISIKNTGNTKLGEVDIFKGLKRILLMDCDFSIDTQSAMISGNRIIKHISDQLNKIIPDEGTLN